ncbi:hypothetical protein PG993_010498 [Apiospora rasikravindrae]|uniref:Uncharacterized protein n=1 Tax=Apiospora rasikravindrae TaxID=990691 RepID=A0ABR1SME7_9PEZI
MSGDNPPIPAEDARPSRHTIMPAGEDQVPTMDVRTCIEPPSDSANNAVTSTSQCSISPLLRLPKELRDEIYGAAAVSLWMGETRAPIDKDPIDDGSTHLSFIFAYHPHFYNMFIQKLSEHASEYKGLTISPGPVTQPGSPRFAKLIEPMCIMRGLDNVWFNGLAESLSLKLLEQEMTRSFNSAVDLIKIQNRSSHKFLTQLKKSLPTCRPHELYIGKIIGYSIYWAREAFEFAGMTSRQLREAHLYSAFAFQAEAEFMDLIHCDASAGWGIAYPFQHHNGSPTDFEDDGTESYKSAAKHLFYAKELAQSYNILQDLDGDDKALCHKIISPPPEALEVLERKIPLMGTWKVDPEVWRRWGRNGAPWMKKLLQQRHTVDSGIEPERQGALVSQYGAEGVTWHHVAYLRDLFPRVTMITNNPDYQD